MNCKENIALNLIRQFMNKYEYDTINGRDNIPAKFRVMGAVVMAYTLGYISLQEFEAYQNKLGVKGI